MIEIEECPNCRSRTRAWRDNLWGKHGWLRCSDPWHNDVLDDQFDDHQFFADAFSELRAAREKFPDEEGVLTDAEWLAVLVEEVGECAHAMQDETDERLREELLQVAAMAARWARSIPQGRGRVPWAKEGSR